MLPHRLCPAPRPSQPPTRRSRKPRASSPRQRPLKQTPRPPQQGAAPDAGSDEGDAGSAAAPQPRWEVAGGKATLSVPGGQLQGTLTYTAEGNRLQFASSDGQTAGISLDGITHLAVQGTDGDDAVTVDLRGAPAGMKLDLAGGEGSDSLTVAARRAQSSYSTTADGLRLVREGLTFDIDGFEQVIDQASGTLTVTGGGSDLNLHGNGDQVTLSGLLGQLVMLFGAPLVEAILDAGNGSVVVDGNLRWADHGTSLALQGRTVTITAGSSIDTGTGDIDLRAHDESSGQSGNASAAVTVTEASLRGGVITISAIAENTLTGSNAVQGGASAVILVKDSELSALGGISLLSSSTAIGRATATANVAQADAARDAANASVALSSTSLARILGASTVRAGGLLSIRAANLTEALARADASRASAGGGIARAVVTRTTSAGIHGPVDVAARGLEVTASARGKVVATSLGSLAGAIANDLTPYAVTGGLARTTGGYVPTASSLSFARLTGVTEAGLSSGPSGRLHVVAVEPVRVLAGGASSVDADASSLGGRGAAAAIALSDLATRATLSGRLDLDSPSVAVNAENTSSRLGATADSAGGQGVSVGALAVGVARTVTASTLAAGAVLTGRQGATDAVFGSSSTGSASADAAAGGAAPSLAVLVADHTTESVADLGSDLVAPHDATWRARTRDVAVSDASRGSAAGNAVTLSTVRTRALLAAGPALTGSGSLTLEADQEAEARSRATLVALTFTDHRAIARSDRDVRMSGPVTVSARNRTTSTSVTNPAVDGPGVSPALVVALLRDLADHVALSQSAAGTGSASLPALGSAVVDSIALNVVHHDASAVLPDGITVVSGGPLGVLAESFLTAVATGGSAGGSGSSADHTAVAVNLVRRVVVVVVSRETESAGDLTVRAGRGPPGTELISASSPSHPGSTTLNQVTSSVTTTVRGTTTIDSTTGATPVAAPQTPAFTPPAGSVLITSRGGTVRLGAATLTFAPGTLAADTWILIRLKPGTSTGVLATSAVYELLAFDAATGQAVTTFAVAPVLSVEVGSSAGRSIDLLPRPRDSVRSR